MSDQQKNKAFVWWKHGVIYHIYPRSYCDSNGDGIGDIGGIIQKLDYIHDLGVDAIWLSPVFPSPMVDFGYDVTNYKDIDPVFGSLTDFQQLLFLCHEKGIKVILDMVLNHTSDQHPWFLDARNSENSKYRDWYIWQKGKKGVKPNNWKSAFGGSAWEYNPKTSAYYLHTFFKQQPDLNWRNSDLEKTFLNIFKFWLDMGVDGFRLDAVNMIVKDKKLRNNPGFLSGLFGQKKWFTRNRPKSYKIVKRLRKLIDSYDNRMLVGEIYTLPPGDAELAGSYLKTGDDGVHLAFDFTLMFQPWNSKRYFKVVEKWYATIPEKGWPCHVLSNHDLRRIIRSFGNSDTQYKKARVAAMFLLTQKGTPFIYYGEEIGMKNAKIKRKALQDPLGKKFWPVYKGRDKVRTPMQWSDNAFSGFSENQPWLPVNPDYKIINVKEQQFNPDSILNFYKKLIQLRKQFKALHAGYWIPVQTGEDGIIIYYRIKGDEKMLVILNFTSRGNSRSKIMASKFRVIVSTHRVAGEYFHSVPFYIYPYEATLVEDISQI